MGWLERSPDLIERSSPVLLSPEVHALAERSVLCWLATVDAEGMPNVSPKEIFALLDDRHLVIAHIASPNSVRNLRAHPKACVSFVDVFAQKGFKISGSARVVTRDDADYTQWAAPLEQKAGPRFPLHGVIVIEAAQVETIVAPSYRLYPEQTTEQSQVESAMRAYGVKPRV